MSRKQCNLKTTIVAANTKKAQPKKHRLELNLHELLELDKGALLLQIVL